MNFFDCTIAVGTFTVQVGTIPVVFLYFLGYLRFTTQVTQMTFLYILLYISPIYAFQSYQASIPNGNNINVESSPWPGLGHTNRGGGGKVYT